MRAFHLALRFSVAAPAGALWLAIAGCSAPASEVSARGSAAIDADEAGAAPSAPAGSLVLYAIPPSSPLDWSTPNHLLDTVAASAAAGEVLVAEGSAALSHEIGHVNLELDCGSTSFPLTGQTGGGSSLKSGADGAGVLLRDFPGAMNEMDNAIGDNADTVADIAARVASGNLTEIRFLVNQAMCTRLKTFHDQYVASGAYVNYGSLYRPRRFEGAGCAIFGAGVVDVGGLLGRSLFTPVWAQTLFIGSARIANTLGANAYYGYGSNLVTRDASGLDWIWPAGVNVPAPTFSPILPESGVMDAWTGPSDEPFAIPGVTLAGPMATAIPFTLYDPALMVAWAEGVWAQAQAQGSASSLGATWTADTVQAVHRVTYDATSVAPQTIAFDADNDDLFLDSDAP